MSLPEEVELYRDRSWCREPERAVTDVFSAERFIESVGFCATLTDARRPGPSLFIAVCGRRDAYMPRNVQKDPESNLAWNLKDQVMRRGQVYYAKLARGRSTFVARRLVPYFNCLWGAPATRQRTLSVEARSLLKVLRREWEMATGDLHQASHIPERAKFLLALDELKPAFRIKPSEFIYKARFTSI